MENKLTELISSTILLMLIAIFTLIFFSMSAYTLGGFTIWIFNINYSITLVEAIKGGLVLLMLKIILSISGSDK